MCLFCAVDQCCATCKRSNWMGDGLHLCPLSGVMDGEDGCEDWRPLVFVSESMGPQVFGNMDGEGIDVQ